MPTPIQQENGRAAGNVSESDVQCLIDVLEEEDSKDVDYFIDLDTVDILEDNGASMDDGADAARRHRRRGRRRRALGE